MTCDTQSWVSELVAAGVPAGPILSVPEALAQPQVRERGLIGEFADTPGVGRSVSVARAGMCFDGQRPMTHQAPPGLGRDTDAILGELGYDDDAISTLREHGAI